MLGFEVAAYVEAQIEQGQRLETAGVPIGVVTRIQGVRRFAVEVLGEAVHAGTMPRAHRRDALSATLAMVAEPERPTADPNDVAASPSAGSRSTRRATQGDSSNTPPSHSANSAAVMAFNAARGMRWSLATVAGSSTPVARYDSRSPHAGHEGRQLSAVSHQRSAIGYQRSAISSQRPTMSQSLQTAHVAG
ncbi:MAG: hypothetical protein V3R98_07920 [Alphaproteobacteria bacterium]